MKKTVLLFVIAFLLTPFVFAGGGNQRGIQAYTGTGEGVEVTYPINLPGEKKLTMWAPITGRVLRYMPTYKEHSTFQEFARHTGIDVDYIHPAVGQEREQLALLVAAGDLPDILQINALYPGGPVAGVAEGIFMDLTNLVRIHAPDYFRLITENENRWRRATTEEGHIHSMMMLRADAPIAARPSFRKDLMVELGLSDPVTIADYENHLGRMREVGITGYILPANGKEGRFMWPYGITPGWFIGTDGRVKYGEYEPAYLEYLTLMNRWYANGYISRDFLNNSEELRYSSFIARDTGMIIITVDGLKARADASNVEIAAMSPWPRLYPGQPIHFNTATWEPVPTGTNGQAVISTNTRNPALAAQWLNYGYTQDGADIVNYGVLGLTYTIDDQGRRLFTDYVFNHPVIPLGETPTALVRIYPWPKLSEPDVRCAPPVVASAENLALRMKDWGEGEDISTVDGSQVMPPLQLSMEDNLRRSEIMRDITTYMNEMTIRFIIGTEPLSNFNSYLENIRRMGIDEAFRITENAYNKYMSNVIQR